MIDERRLAALSIGNTQSRKLEDVLGKMSEDDLWELRELMRQIEDFILKCAGLKESAPVIALRKVG